MNPRTIPVKRRPVSSGFFKRIHAVTRNRTQHAATAACFEDLESPEHSARISRGFTIIVLFHVVAIALYFIHLKFLNDHSVGQAAAPPAAVPPVAPKPRVVIPSVIAPAEATTIGVAGDTYARIAAREGVDENALRAANKNKTLSAGLTVKLPPKRTSATEAAELAASGSPMPAVAEGAQVATEPEETLATPKAVVVLPNVVRETKAASETKSAKAAPETKSAKATSETKSSKAASETKSAKAASAGRSYVVKSGDNMYRICKRYKVEQTALMRANGITDPHKLNTGMTLVIPR